MAEALYYFKGCYETKECFFIAVPDQTATIYMPTIEQCIANGSTIFSDCSKRYKIEKLSIWTFYCQLLV